MSKETKYWKIKEDEIERIFEKGMMINLSPITSFSQNEMPIDEQMCADLASEIEKVKLQLDDYLDDIKSNIIAADDE